MEQTANDDEEVNKGLRIINFIIDLFVIGLISEVLNIALNTRNPTIISYLVYVLYYLLFELYNGQTLGKKMTRTVVVDNDDLKPKFTKIILRTIMRLNPLDTLSYLFGQEQGTHDLLSRTRLIKKPR